MSNLLILRLFLKAKLIVILSRWFKLGSGTSLPGISVETRHQRVLKTLCEPFEKIILISGTNGKTTTRALINHIYEENGKKVCSNLGGANLIRGIATSLLLNLNRNLKPINKIAVFEVEEASLPILTKYFKADILILTNVFRDQLDAYGEIEKTVDYFRKSLLNLGFTINKDLSSKNFVTTSKDNQSDSQTKVIINSQDGKLVNLISEFKLQPLSFSVSLPADNLPKYEAKAKNKIQPDVTAEKVLIKGFKQEFRLKLKDGKSFKIYSNLPGNYNIYNILAAFLAVYPDFKKQVVASISTFVPVFGRGEKVLTKNKNKINLFLIKNPAGFNQVLDLMKSNFGTEKFNLCLCINDKTADGRDVSWLWDSEIENYALNKQTTNLITGGTRGYDILLRLQYAGFEVSSKNCLLSFQEVVEKILNTKKDWVVLANYTAMLDFRKELSKYINLKEMHQQGN